MPLLGFVLYLLASAVSVSACGPETEPPTDAEPSEPSEGRYAGYWLVAEHPSSYQILVLTRLPLSQFEAPCPDASLSILDCEALWLETYRRQSIWNTDLRPIKALDEIKWRRDDVVVFQAQRYRLEPAELDEVVSVLRYDSLADIHRIFAPHAGQEEEIAELADRIEAQLGGASSE